jgi:hypothetical protein
VPKTSAQWARDVRKTVAWAIKRKIKKVGTKGYWVFKKTMDVNTGKVNKMIRDLADNVQRIIGRG